jgi:hypothetical protein
MIRTLLLCALVAASFFPAVYSVAQEPEATDPATEVAPPSEEAAPATEEAAPATEEAAPATEEAAPATEEAAPATEEAAPVEPDPCFPPEGEEFPPDYILPEHCPKPEAAPAEEVTEEALEEAAEEPAIVEVVAEAIVEEVVEAVEGETEANILVLTEDGATPLGELASEEALEAIATGDPYFFDPVANTWRGYFNSLIGEACHPTVTGAGGVCTDTATPLTAAITAINGVGGTAAITLFIEARPGGASYTEAVTLNRSNVTLQGTGSPVIDGSLVVSTTANNTTISGITFVALTQVTANEINLQSDGNVITGNTFLGPGWTTNPVTGTPDVVNFAIANNAGSDGNLVSNNFFQGFRQAWNMGGGGANNTFTGNTVLDVKGILVAFDPMNLTVTNNVGVGSAGPPLGVSGVVIVGAGATTTTICNNTFSNFNEGAIKIQSTSPNLDITTCDNVFQNNTNAIIITDPLGAPQDFGPDTYINNTNLVFYNDPLPSPHFVSVDYYELVGSCNVQLGPLGGAAPLLVCTEVARPGSGPFGPSGPVALRPCTNNPDFAVFIIDQNKDFDIYRINGSQGLGLKRYAGLDLNDFQSRNQNSTPALLGSLLPQNINALFAGRNEDFKTFYIGNDQWRFELRVNGALVRSDICTRR